MHNAIIKLIVIWPAFSIELPASLLTFLHALLSYVSVHFQKHPITVDISENQYVLQTFLFLLIFIQSIFAMLCKSQIVTVWQ